MTKEVKIQLTAAQKAKIKAVTGKTLSEIRVSSLGKNLAVSTGQKSTRLAGAALRGETPRIGAASLRAETQRSLRAETQRSLRGEAPRSIGSESFRAGDDDA